MSDKRIKRVAFADKKLFESFNQLKSGRFEDKQLVKYLELTIDKLKHNPFYGLPIPRKLWPIEYLRNFGIDNLRKCNLPNGWRLIYTLKGNEVEIVSIVLEWFSHKSYEKRFGYKSG